MIVELIINRLHTELHDNRYKQTRTFFLHAIIVVSLKFI